MEVKVCSFGSRGTKTGQQLWEKLEKKEIGEVMTDRWRAYAEFLPETIHTQSKAETYTIEGYNGILRHFLARLRRKTKCYTKNLEMIKYSILLLMKYRIGLTRLNLKTTALNLQLSKSAI